MATRYPETAESTVEQLNLNLGEVFDEEVPVIPRYELMEHALGVGKQGMNPGELWYPCGVAIDETSKRIYVTGEENACRVSIFSERGEFVNSFTHEHMKWPLCVAFHKNNVYVTDIEVYGVFHFKIEADIRLVAELVGWGSSKKQFDYPRELAVSDNGDLYIADSHNHRIQILDESLQFQRSITHHSMHYPYGVKLTTDEVYVLSSEDSPCIHVFSYAGDKLRSLITRGEGMQVTEAWYFCLDAEKNLIIIDDSFKVFAPNGTLLHTIPSVRSYETMGIALTQSLKLVFICPNINGSLFIISN